jgi:large subunit ribosomal protein L32
MPVPKRKTSKKRRDQRSANKGLKALSITSCQTCKDPIAPHSACNGCGYYKGVKILRTKIERLIERNNQKEQAEVKERAEHALSEQKEVSDDATKE